MDNRCIKCGCLIPEGESLCSACGDYDDMQRFYDEQDKQREELKNAVRLTAKAVDELSEALIRAETTPCIQFGGKMITIAEAIKILRNGNGGTVMKWRKCSEANPKTARNALVVVDGKITIAHWSGTSWIPLDWRIEFTPTHWQNLPLLPAELAGNQNES